MGCRGGAGKRGRCARPGPAEGAPWSLAAPKPRDAEAQKCFFVGSQEGQEVFLLPYPSGDASRQISDLKFKLTKSEQEITALEQNVIRLESQVSRYKSAAENAEKIEDELKAEKRKLQRELRSALDKTEELEVSNGHLVKRLEKMKANRSALLSQQ
ncbi:leucine-rich repeat flightless-interacting protein 2-like [Fukomys damarensis]|uniref:leucine-rich repeat flightless-interacting protein 2-like n=1 Tax=Fukomys damarensis TaxID=885580 RepID=UPI001455B35C|nr:leucine-rich repeat flightless-interacting protein 2-like [Fukomys damarensis]